jgi:RNA polymerase sigma-70 factor (ECF subfamily)
VNRTDQERRLEVLIRANASDLLAYLERRIDPRADAADVLSETFMVAWKKAGKAPADEVGGRMWLFAIARNMLLNAHRSTRRRLAVGIRLRQELEQPLADTDDLDALALREAVRQLPVGHRELIELVHWEGFSVVEAARITGVSSSTARSRYAAAKQRLRLALAVEPQDSLS